MVGKILTGSKSGYQVALENEVIFTKARGALLKSTTILIGDNVLLDSENQIEALLPRVNELYRPKIANLDYGVIICSLKTPEFSHYLLDKFLTLLIYSKVQPLIVFSKSDLLTAEETVKYEELGSYYQSLGFSFFLLSISDSKAIEEFKKVISGKCVAFMGQTGSGKSSLINALDSSFKRDIGSYSVSLGRGKHQTKEVIFLPFLKGYLADTPGFSSLELEIYQRDLSVNFPGFLTRTGKCFFKDCQHINEIKCQIKDEVKAGIINSDSYQNYLAIYEELKRGKYE